MEQFSFWGKRMWKQQKQEKIREREREKSIINLIYKPIKIVVKKKKSQRFWTTQHRNWWIEWMNEWIQT